MAPGDRAPSPTRVEPEGAASVRGDGSPTAARSPGVGPGGGCAAGSGPKENPASAASAAKPAAASRTSLSPLAVPARAAWVTAARAAGGTAVTTRAPAPEATAEASRWAVPAGAGRPARPCRVAAVTREAYRAPNTATPVAVPTWRSVLPNRIVGRLTWAHLGLGGSGI